MVKIIRCKYTNHMLLSHLMINYMKSQDGGRFVIMQHYNYQWQEIL